MISKIAAGIEIPKMVRRANRSIKQIAQNTPAPQSSSSGLVSARENLERQATEMSPNEYIMARNYLASIEHSYRQKYGKVL